MPKNLFKLDAGKVSADILKDEYCISPIDFVKQGAKSQTYYLAAKKKTALHHYIFYFQWRDYEKIRKEIEKWKPDEIEYKETKKDIVNNCFVGSCTSFVEKWNLIGKVKKFKKIENYKPVYEYVDVPIGIVTIILHGLPNVSAMLIPKPRDRNMSDAFDEDLKQWEEYEGLLKFPLDEIPKLNSKKIQTLIILNCFGGQYEDDNVAKAFLKNNKAENALAVDGFSKIPWTKDDTFTASKQYINYPNGEETRTNKDKAENFKMLCDYAHGKY